MTSISCRSTIQNNSNLHVNVNFTVTESSTSTVNNTSTMSYSWSIVLAHDLTFVGTSRPNAGTAKFYINGSQVKAQVVPLTKGQTSGTIASGSGTTTVAHDSGGKKTISIKCEMVTGTDQNNYGYVWSAVNKSADMVLTNIPRASDISVDKTSMTYGDTVTVTLDKKVSSYTHDIQLQCNSGDWQTLNSDKVDSSYSFTLTTDYASQLINTSNTITLRAVTYNGDTSIGSKDSTAITVTTPSDMLPTTAITLTEGNSGNTLGIWVQNHSTIVATTAPVNAYGSTITKDKVTVNDGDEQSSPYSYIAKSSGSYVFKALVTDSRGMSKSASKTATVYAYTNPEITNISFYRCDSDGTKNEEGAYGYVSASYSLTDLNSKNSHTVTVQYKKHVEADDKYVSIALQSDSYSAGTGTAVAIFPASVSSSYDFKVLLTDAFETETQKRELSTASTIFNIMEDRFAYGKMAEYEKSFEIPNDWKYRIGGNDIMEIISSMIYPVDSVLMYANADINPNDNLSGTWEEQDSISTYHVWKRKG